jgi:zinc transporter ZupT
MLVAGERILRGTGATGPQTGERRRTMKLRYTNLLGLLAIIGTVTGLVGIGIFYPINPLLAIPFALLALCSLVIFVKFVHHFIYYHPLGEIPDEEAKASYRDDD